MVYRVTIKSLPKMITIQKPIKNDMAIRSERLEVLLNFLCKDAADYGKSEFVYTLPIHTPLSYIGLLKQVACEMGIYLIVEITKNSSWLFGDSYELVLRANW